MVDCSLRRYTIYGIASLSQCQLPSSLDPRLILVSTLSCEKQFLYILHQTLHQLRIRVHQVLVCLGDIGSAVEIAALFGLQSRYLKER